MGMEGPRIFYIFPLCLMTNQRVSSLREARGVSLFLTHIQTYADAHTYH